MLRWSKIENIDEERTLKIIEKVEKETGYTYCPMEIANIVQYAIRKCELNGKDEEYFYILLPDELEQYLMRAYINLRGEQNRRRKENVRGLQTTPVSPAMP